MMEQKAIAVFGGREALPGEYEEALKLGRLLAASGFAVMNGGYSGIMEAVSRGAMEAGGAAIGVTVEIFRDLPPNAFLTREIRTRHFFERLEILTAKACGFIVLRGGMGTLTEVSLVWNLLQTRTMEAKPMILVGDYWKPIFETLARHLMVSESDLQLMAIVPTVEAAVEHLHQELLRT